MRDCRAGSGRKRVFEEERRNIVREEKERGETNRRCGAHIIVLSLTVQSQRERERERAREKGNEKERERSKHFYLSSLDF